MSDIFNKLLVIIIQLAQLTSGDKYNCESKARG